MTGPGGERPALRVGAGLLACVGLAAGVRVAVLAQAPPVSPDTPAYLDMAAMIGTEDWSRILHGYYPPALPLLIRGVHELTGLGFEASGRAVSMVAGVATVGVTGLLAARMLGGRAALLAALLAAIHGYLVRASSAILPEMLFGLVVAAWGLSALVPGGPLRLVGAAVLAGTAHTARIEGIGLVPLTIVAAAAQTPPGRRLRRAALAALVLLAVLTPLLFLARPETARWAASSKEVHIIARRYGLEDTSLAQLVLRHPLTLLSTYPENLRRQVGYVLSIVLVPLVPFLFAGLGARLPATAAVRARALTLLTLAGLTAAVATINPGKRYVTAFLPLLLPWVGLGVLRVGTWAGAGGPRTSRVVWRMAAAGAVALAVHAVWPERRRWDACYAEVCRWLAAQPEAGRTVMVRDSRLPYVCGVPSVWQPRHRSPEAIVDFGLARGAALWIVKAARRPTSAPPQAREVARLCTGREQLVVYALGSTSTS